MAELYDIHYPSGRTLERVKEMLTTYDTVLVRPIGKMGNYAICTLSAAEEIVAALNAYRTPKLISEKNESDNRRF